MMNWIRRGLRSRTAWCRAALVGCLLAVSGCGSGFFNPSSTGTGSGGGGTGGTPPPPSGGSSLDSIYVLNSSLATIAGFSLSSAGALASLTVSPNTLTSPPSVLAINPAGSLVWVGGLYGQLDVYIVNSNGTLSHGNNNQSLPITVSASAMVVDPSGNYLLVLSNTGSLGGGTTSAPTISVYQIDQTSGALTQLNENGSPTVALDAGSGFQIAFAPNGTQVYVALGTGGVDALTFNPANGGLSKLAVHLSPTGNAYADQGLAFDPLGQFLFVTETGVNGVRVFAISSDSTLNEVAGSPYPAGLGAKSVVVDSTGAYVYVGNSTTNTISGFSLSSTGALTELAGSPYVTGSSPYSLAEDNTGGYLVAACTGGNPDLQVFSITGATGTTPGALVSVATASTGNASPAGASALVVTP